MRLKEPKKAKCRKGGYRAVAGGFTTSGGCGESLSSQILREIRGEGVGSKTNTSVANTYDNFTTVRLYATQIVRFNEEKIILDSGGHKTATTKRRMNEVSNEYDLGFEVKTGPTGWVVYYREDKLPFVDEMVLDRNRTIQRGPLAMGRK